MPRPAPSRCPAAPEPGDRRPGISLALALAMPAAWIWLWTGTVWLWTLPAAVVVALATALIPRRMYPLFRTFHRSSTVLHQCLSVTALTVVFFGFVTPAGALWRLFRHHAMPRGKDEAVHSYWLPVDEPVAGRDSFRDQF